MRKGFFLILILSVFSMIFIIGCQPTPPQQREELNEEPTEILDEDFNAHHEIKEDLQDKMRIVEESTVPKSIREWFDEFGKHEGAYIYQHPDATYVKINMGERPTGGYGIRVVDYDEEEYPRVILVDFIVPDDDELVTQVITYPSVILQINTDMAADYQVITTDGMTLPVEKKMVFALLDLPEENQEIGNPVEIKGKIIAFEGTFIVRILDDKDELIHEEHLQADAGGPYWGNFHNEIRYPVPKRDKGRIEIGEYSAKDGEYIMRQQVSVKFKNTSQ